MSESIPHLNELERLLAKLVDDLLADEERARLETMLCESAAVRRHYFWYLDLHAELAARLDQSGIAQPPNLFVPPSHRPTACPEQGRRVPSPARTPVVGFLSRISRQVPGGEVTVGGLVVFVIAVAFWGLSQAIMHPNLGGQELAHDLSPLGRRGDRGVGLGLAVARGEGHAVATVRDTQDVEWSPRREASLPPAIRRGESLQITAGLIELQLTQGTKLLIQGPAEWSIDGDNNATLKRGKLVARVPESAHGFTLNTPTSIIVDLGTEFAVVVAERGSTDVHVLTGEIDFVANASPTRNAPAKTRRLVAGEAARVDAGSADVATAAFSPEKFAAMKPARGKPRGRLIAIDLSQGAVASQSSTLTEGPGLKPQPSTAIDGDVTTCSHTGREDTAPWWQVDLGVPRDLAAVAIQNRLDCCAGRLRDIEVLVLAEDGTTVVYRTPPLNQKNLDWGTAEFLRGPSQLTADLKQPDGAPVRGRYVRIQRTTEPSAEAIRAEHQVLSLAEVQLFEIPETP